MIEFDQVTFAYASGEPLLAGFSWRVLRGEHWAVLGPSGSGKSTLLMLIAALLHPQAGAVRVEGAELAGPTPRNGLILQDCELLPWSTLRRNAELGLRLQRFQFGTAAARLGHDAIAQRTQHWLERLGIAHVAERFPQQVSGGERQRCAIARTLVTEAQRLLMDEPFSALDAPTREGLQELTVALCLENRLSLVIVTHAIEEAVLMGQRILVLRRDRPLHGRVVENPHAWDPEFRYSAQCRARCAELREAMS
jgi:NitT/TauT family transport system ATP-binding protein